MTVETLLTLNYYLALDGLIGIAALVFLIIDLVKYRKLEKDILRWGSWAMFVIVLGSVIMTLVYSELFGIVPCGLCWLERIFLYSQLVVIFVGMRIKDLLMPYYVIALSSVGFVISLYHHYIQMGGSELIACPTAGAGVDCAKRTLFEFGFVTFPLLATIAFGLLIVISVYILKAQNKD